MTIQYIIISLVIASAIGRAAYSLIRSMIKPESKCNGCNSGCGGCAILEIKKTKKPA
ncbi:MAG: FeoB-associated Cys-rich membrane protein [Bacteroidales bacterium]